VSTRLLIAGQRLPEFAPSLLAASTDTLIEP
jgi:hypothetical protein